jgi:hypothetical protein
LILWAKHGTPITVRDILKAATPSATSIAIGTAATVAVQTMMARVEPPFARLVAESTILFGVYLFALLFIMRQKSVLVGLLREIGFPWPFGSRGTVVGKV